MLRLESYLSPFLFGYLSKYIKNIEAKDLQVSLWGGDAVLHNLEFKLDALDNELQNAPFSFVSCHAQELRIHVPWSKLSSESVVITLSTVECTVKLDCYKTLHKPPAVQREDSPAQPSYVSSLLKKIKNNISVHINNLILKYVEDDIVLSINLQSTLYRTVNEFWRPEFVELTEENLVLRRLWELKDVTVCLDKRGASGLVESYEEPLLFRTHFIFREHNVYPTPASRKPSVTKINLLIDRYELSISENQLPLFLHLLQLCLHLYYGSIEKSFVQSDDGSLDDTDFQKQGWASWAWSYVPPVLSYEIEKDEVENTILAFGMYIKNIVVKFKPSQLLSAKQFHTSQTPENKALLVLSAQGFKLEIVAKGLEFFSCLSSLCNGSIQFAGGTPASLNGQVLQKFDSDMDVLLVSSGKELSGFAADSLFDFRSPENNNVLYDYVFSKEAFFASSTQSDDVFLSQYLYIASDKRNLTDNETSFNNYLNSVELTDIEEWSNIHEQSWKRFVIGGNSLLIHVNSFTVMCVDVLNSWATNHNVKPYPLAQPIPITSPEILNDVNFIPSRSSTFTIKNLKVCFSTLCLIPETYKIKAFSRVTSPEKQASAVLDSSNVEIPAILMSIPFCEFTIRQPMYATHFAAYLSNYISPSPNLMKACNTQYCVRIPLLELFLIYAPFLPCDAIEISSKVKSIICLENVLLEYHSLQGKNYWQNRLSMLQNQAKLLLHLFSINVTTKQLELVLHILDSWMNFLSKNFCSNEVLDISNMRDAVDGTATVSSFHITLNNFTVELNQSFASIFVGGALRYFDVYWQFNESIIPVIQCTNSSMPMHSPETFITPGSAKFVRLHEMQTLDWNDATHCLSLYLQIPTTSAGNGCVLFCIHRIFCNLDPKIFEELLQVPSIPLRYLLPCLFSSFSATENAKSEQGDFLDKVKAKYALQVKFHGGQVFLLHESHSCTQEQFNLFPAIHLIQQDVLQSSSNVLSVSLPKVTSFTCGFKSLQISPKLLVDGVTINQFTDFGTLNFGVEDVTVYSVQSSLDRNVIANYLVKPCAAACTVVFKQNKASKVNIALHIDLESIFVELSQSQVALFVPIINSAVKVIIDISKNCYPGSLDQKVTPKETGFLLPKSEDVSDSKITSNPNFVKTEEDAKSTGSTLVLPSVTSRTLPFVLWMQCTLPRFMVSFYCDQSSKTVFFVDDVSMSLDYQAVYTKLMMSLSACNILHSIPVKEDEVLSELMFTPMFATLPSFVQKFAVSKDNVNLKSEVASKPGKFLDLTFTQALGSDYHRNLREDESAYPGSSSAVSTSPECFAMTSDVYVSEIICTIQSFDLLMKPEALINLASIAKPLMKLQLNDLVDSVPAHKTVNVPLIFATLTGARLFLPLGNSNSLIDDVVMICIGKIDINPHPQNPLSRLVVSSQIFKKASKEGLLNFPGSPVEDKQFEIIVEELSLGTTKSIGIISHMKKPALRSDNPALQWNMLGETIVEKPVFHPIIEQVDLKMLYAPSIYYTSKNNKLVLVCGPSFELNIATNLVVHLAAMQLTAVIEVVDFWLAVEKNVSDMLYSNTENNPSIVSLHQGKTNLKVVRTSLTSDKRIKAGINRLIGDHLLTGKKVKVYIYRFKKEDEIKPLLYIQFDDPSFVFHVSKQQQKVVLQFHNACMNSALLKCEAVDTISSLQNFPISVLETLQGECNKRTGVPSSLCTLTINDFLHNKANLKLCLGIPLKLNLTEDVVTCFQQAVFDANSLLSSSDAASSTPSSSAGFFHKFSAFNVETSQLVCEVDHLSYKVQCCINDVSLKLLKKSDDVTGTVDIAGVSIHMCSGKDLLPFLYPVTVAVNLKLQLEPCWMSYTNIKLSSVCLNFSQSILNGISILIKVLQEWTMLFHKKSNGSSIGNDSSKSESSVIIVKPDDLRTEKYIYISQEDIEPLPGQIVFSSSLPISSMTWCYNAPHTIRHVSITPIPFNEILGDSTGIMCTLESFDQAHNCFQVQKSFYVSETKYNDFTLFDEDVPFSKTVFSKKWRVSVHNTSKCHISPLSLAASMNIEAVYDSSKVPNFVCSVEFDILKFTCMSDQEHSLENACFELSRFISTIRTWKNPKKCIEVSVDSFVAFQAVEYQSLSWIPVLLPVPMSTSLLKTGSELDLMCKLTKEVEIHISQRVIHSLQSLTSIFSENSLSTTTVSPFVIENHTCKTIFLGQSLTDESIKLESGSKLSYFWRSNKLEPKMHVSIDGVSDWIWSESFCPYLIENILCEVDKCNSIVAKVDRDNMCATSLVFYGSTRLCNRLDVDIQACLMVNGAITYANCSSGSSTQKDFLFSVKDISTVLFKVLDFNVEATDAVFVSDLLTSPEEVKLVQFVVSDDTVIHAQTHCFKQDMVDVLVIMPIFLVRSFLPDSAILHIETRADNTSFSATIKGSGSQIPLSSLSPYSTHHITIQLSKNESPFDATIPIHYSLKKNLLQSPYIEGTKLVDDYPYNANTYLDPQEENWSSGQGNIQAKLSLCKQSLLVEIVPWCLVCNETDFVFCLTSFDKNVSIIPPEQTITLHHFTGMFNICASNSSYSEWMTLDINPELDHPSRINKLKMHHLPYNGFRTIQLKTSTTLVELLLKSCIHHGVRVLTISPKWIFVNFSSDFPKLSVLPCVEKRFTGFKTPESEIDIKPNVTNSILSWQTDVDITLEVDNDLVSDSPNEDTVGTGSIETMTENTSSSFLCVEPDIYVSDYGDRLLCVKAAELASTVSVKDDFTKKLVQFQSEHMSNQLVLTRHEYFGQFFVVLNDIVKKKYLFQNSSDRVLFLKEVHDDDCNDVVFSIDPNQSITIDSYMDIEMFPICKRKCLAVKFQVSEKANESWTNIVIFSQDYSDEVLLPDALLLMINVVLKDNQVHIDFSMQRTPVDDSSVVSTVTSSISAKELKIVFFDDMSNPLYSVDVIQMLMDDFNLQISKINKKYIGKISVSKFQCDNQLYPGSDFPVFLSYLSEDQNCFLIAVTLSDSFVLEKVEVFPGTVELQSDDAFLQALSRLLQSYLALAHPVTKENNTSLVPEVIANEAKVLSNPLCFQSLIVHPMTLYISLRASITLCVSVDRGVITFSKFVCQDVNTTFGELLQEVMRHYFAEAVYGAGWVIGSVDLLGNPATTLRSYIKGISDFVVLPYQGIMHGPTAFLGGFTRGVFSLVRHFSAGTIRSVTNIASGISRNLNYTSYQQHHDAQTSQLLLDVRRSNSSGNKQLVLQNSQQGYVKGVTKTVVGIVTKPIGGAAGLVSRTGESILRKVGLEEVKTVRNNSATHTTSSYSNSKSKYCLKLIPNCKSLPSQLTSVDCRVICSNGIRFSASLVMSSSTLYIFQLVDDILEMSVAISDIDIRVEKCSNPKHVLLNFHSTVPNKKESVYSNKVANYLGVDEPPEKRPDQHFDVLKYQAEVEHSQAVDLFVFIFKSLKKPTRKFPC